MGKTTFFFPVLNFSSSNLLFVVSLCNYHINYFYQTNNKIQNQIVVFYSFSGISLLSEN